MLNRFIAGGVNGNGIHAAGKKITYFLSYASFCGSSVFSIINKNTVQYRPVTVNKNIK